MKQYISLGAVLQEVVSVVANLLIYHATSSEDSVVDEKKLNAAASLVAERLGKSVSNPDELLTKSREGGKAIMGARALFEEDPNETAGAGASIAVEEVGKTLSSSVKKTLDKELKEVSKSFGEALGDIGSSLLSDFAKNPGAFLRPGG